MSFPILFHLIFLNKPSSLFHDQYIIKALPLISLISTYPQTLLSELLSLLSTSANNLPRGTVTGPKFSPCPAIPISFFLSLYIAYGSIRAISLTYTVLFFISTLSPPTPITLFIKSLQSSLNKYKGFWLFHAFSNLFLIFALILLHSSFSSSPGKENTIISLRRGCLRIKKRLSIRGILVPYKNLLTSIWSPTFRVGIIEPEGILNACTTKALIKSARSIAITIASTYSLNFDFLAIYLP